MVTERKIHISLNADENGYISQECPACKRHFKIKPGEGSDQPVSYCPYCAHQGQDCWWTQEQADYLSGVVGKTLIEPKLDKMAKDFNREAGSGNFINMTMAVKHSSNPTKPEEPNDKMPLITFECCGESIKHDGNNSALNCIICGKEKECALD